MTVTVTKQNPTPLSHHQRTLVNPPRNQLLRLLRMFSTLLASRCLRLTCSRILALILHPLVFLTSRTSHQRVAQSIHRTSILSGLCAVFLLLPALKIIACKPFVGPIFLPRCCF